MSPDQQQFYYGRTSGNGLEIWPDNWRAVSLFCFCATQWQFSESGHRLALSYPAVQAVLQMHRIPPRQHGRLLADIRLIEFGALEALKEKLEQSSNGA